MQFDPGAGPYAYNNTAINLAGLVAQRAAEQRLHVLAAERLFLPLGIERSSWQQDARGFSLCMAGVNLSASDLARVAALLLTQGRCGDRQIVDASWVAAMPPRDDVGVGCFGAYAWLARSEEGLRVGPRIGFGHGGDYGQVVTIQPANELVAVRLRATRDRSSVEMWNEFDGDVHRQLGRRIDGDEPPP